MLKDEALAIAPKKKTCVEQFLSIYEKIDAEEMGSTIIDEREFMIECRLQGWHTVISENKGDAIELRLIAS